MSGFDVDTSTDELAASLGVRYPSPARARRRLPEQYASTPLAQRSPNVQRKQLNMDVTPSWLRGMSPAKSMFFDPDPEQGGADSPWRIKVTVQAEPRHGSSPAKSPAPRTRVMRVPLKDADGSSPVKPKVGRKRKSDADSAIKNRKGTPMRRRSGRNSQGRKSTEPEQDQTPAPQEQPVKRRRGRPRKATLDEDSILDMISNNPTPAVEKSVPRPESEDLPIEDQQYEEEREADVPQEDEHFDYHDDPAKKIPEGEDHVSEGDYQVAGEDEDVDFVHVDTYPESEESDVEHIRNGDIEEEEEGNNAEVEAGDEEAPEEQAHQSDLPNPRDDRNLSRLEANAFDFTKLTPLHVRHSIAPQKLPTPKQQDPRGSYVATELYNDRFRGMFSRLPQRQSTSKSPAPFSKRDSSPATEKDADMWRDMLPQSRRQSSKWQWQEGPSAQDEQQNEEDEDELEDELPDMTSKTADMTARTIGDNTMMQSEDFSIVSLSSLPSAKDINSSLLSRSGGDQSRIDHSVASSRKPSRLQKAVTFSSPLAQSTHTYREEALEEEEDPEGDSEAEVGHSLPQKPTPQKSIMRASQSSISSNPAPGPSPPHSRLTTPPAIKNKTNRLGSEYRMSYSGVSQPRKPQQTPVTEQSRLLTPSSGENQNSPPGMNDLPQSDISYPEVDDTVYPEIQDTPAKSEAEMSTPPATPERDESPKKRRTRETSLMSSGSRRSWVEEPQSARMLALEKKWQDDRDNVKRTISMFKNSPVTIEDDVEEEESDDEDELARELAAEADAMADAMAEKAEKTADIWQDISASYDEGESHISRKSQLSHPRPASRNERPSKAARTERRPSPGSRDTSEEGHSVPTPQKSFNAEQNMASVKRRANVKNDVSALFGRLHGGSSFTSTAHNGSSRPTNPSPLRNTFIDGAFEETDISALSDVRQIRNEMKAAAQKRPPFPIVSRGTTTTVPTKLKSIDDTMTTQGDEEGVESEREYSQDQSVLSFTGQQRASRSLFSEPRHEALIEPRVKLEPQPYATTDLTTQDAVPARENFFSCLWKTITFSHPYISPPRPDHPILASAEAYPLLPSIWSWSHSHWQTLDNLYQYYKRKPSRFSSARKSRPDNKGLMTNKWFRFTDITFEHWGYRIRLEDSHITLAILYMQLLVLPSEKEYVKVSGEELEYRHQDQMERKGERITEWDVLLHLFAIIAGEMLREDEAIGRRVRRDLVDFRYRLKGDARWRCVHDAPVF